MERKYSVVEKYRSPLPFDLELLGKRDAALVASIANATKGWTYVHAGRCSPRADRLVMFGTDTHKDKAFVLFDGAGNVAGASLSNGTHCVYERPDADESRVTLECAAPPWTEMKPISVGHDQPIQMFEAGERVVSVMMDDRLDVIDADGKNHATYAAPVHGVTTMLGDGRTIAIKGDDAVALVDVVDETYALIPLTPAQVVPVVCDAKAFIAQDGGPSGSIVSYE